MRSFTFASCALYLLIGMSAVSIGSVMPKLLSHYDGSLTIGGQLIFIGALGSLFGVLVASYLNHHFQPKPLLILSAALIACSQFGIFVLPSLPLVMTLYFLNSMGSSLVLIVVATLFLEVFVGRQAVSMSYLEVAYGLGAFVMPLIAGLFLALDMWRYVFFLNSIFAFVMLFVWQHVTYSRNVDDQNRQLDAEAQRTYPLTLGEKWTLLGLFSMLIFLNSGLEGSIDNFISSVFTEYLNVAAYYASGSVGLFWLAMVIGRIFTAFIIRKWSYYKYLSISICGAIIAFSLFILFQNAVIGFLLIAVLGFSMSGIYSITLVYANALVPESTRLVTPLISGFSGLGGAVFPGFIGFSFDHAGMVATLWILPSMAACYLIFLFIIFSKYRKLQQRLLQS